MIPLNTIFLSSHSSPLPRGMMNESESGGLVRAYQGRSAFFPHASSAKAGDFFYPLSSERGAWGTKAGRAKNFVNALHRPFKVTKINIFPLSFKER